MAEARWEDLSDDEKAERIASRPKYEDDMRPEGPAPRAVQSDGAGIRLMMSNAFLHLGTRVPSYGRIKSVHSLGGERYYGFVDGHGVVSVIDERTVLSLVLGDEPKRGMALRRKRAPDGGTR